MKEYDTWQNFSGFARYVTLLSELPDGKFGSAQANASGHQYVEVSGGSLTATVDTSALATQTTLAAVLAKMTADPATQTTLAAILAKLTTPTLHTAIVASDATDLTALANVGVIVGGAGNLAYRLTGAPSTTVTLAVVAGQFVPGAFARVMAATTATGIVGVSL